MEFTVEVHSCTEHDECSVHICTTSVGDVVWESHAHSDVNDGCRLNVDHPSAIKGDDIVLWQPGTPDEARLLEWDKNTHRIVTTLGTVLELVPVAIAATMSGFTEAQLVEEAQAWAVASA